MDSTAAVLAILSKLQSLGFCTGSGSPTTMLPPTPRRRSTPYSPLSCARCTPAGARRGLSRRRLAMGAAVSTSSASSSPSAPREATPPCPPPSSAAAAAESAGLDAALVAPIKLLYAKYLGALDRWIQRLVEAHGPFLDSVGRKKQELFIGTNGMEKEEPFLNSNEREQQHMMLKRKREDIAGMLDWVREIAENAQDGGVVAAGSVAGYLSMALAVREAVIRKRARRGRMTNVTLMQENFPKDYKCCMSPASFRFGAKAKCTEQLQLMVHHPDSDISKLTTVVENMNGSLMVIGQENNLSVQGEHEHRMHHNCSDGCLFTSQQWNEIPVGPDYQAQVPQRIDELPVNYDDPETLRWLGTKVWPPGNENRKALFCCDPIGKGRDVVCGCNLPGSVECVRFHVAERRLKLKLEIGSAFYAWGFDRMGEEIALSWTDEEEAKFKASAQLKAPSSGRNFWNRLHLLFQPKGRKELVSYYFNCFLLRRRCYQNRITPKNIDSDDDEETEFRFLGNRLGHIAAKYHNTKHSVCIQNTHCMNLDE